MAAWMGLMARSGTPPEIVKKLADTFERIAKDPNNIAKIEKLGFTADYGSPTEMAAMIRRDVPKMKEVADRAGIKEE